jgi:hypothetical protein
VGAQERKVRNLTFGLVVFQTFIGCQEGPGGGRGSQEEPEGARRSQEESCAARRSQLGGARRSQGEPGGARRRPRKEKSEI